MRPLVRACTVTMSLIVGACRPASPPTPPPSVETTPLAARAVARDPLADVEQRIEHVMRAYDVPGLSVAIVKDGEVVLARGFGSRTVGKNEPVDPDTIFAIASNTKAFVATAVALLEHEGKLDLDDRVVDRLPTFATWNERTTEELLIRDLLCHRAGLDTWAGDLLWIGDPDLETKDILAKLPYVPSSAGVRARYGYTNLMFVVAGEVIRTITGETWDAFVRQRILLPLGMQRTTATVDGLAGLDNVATPHMDIDGTLAAIPYLDVDSAGAAGALNSSAADMARWLMLQLDEGRFQGKQIVPAEVIATLRIPHTPTPLPTHDILAPSRHFISYGLGWFLHDYQGRLVVTHGGGLPGMTSRAGLVPEEDLAVVVLTNSESHAAQLIFYDLLDGFFGVEHKDYVALQRARDRAQEAENAEEPPTPGTPEPTTLEALASSYTNPLLGRAVVTDEDGTMRLHLPDHGGLDCFLKPLSVTSFDCTWSNPIFESSVVHVEAESRTVRSLRFRVRPGFVDPLEYEFTRSEARNRPAHPKRSN